MDFIILIFFLNLFLLLLLIHESILVSNPIKVIILFNWNFSLLLQLPEMRSNKPIPAEMFGRRTAFLSLNHMETDCLQSNWIFKSFICLFGSRGRLVQWKNTRFVNFCSQGTMVRYSLQEISFQL